MKWRQDENSSSNVTFIGNQINSKMFLKRNVSNRMKLIQVQLYQWDRWGMPCWNGMPTLLRYRQDRRNEAKVSLVLKTAGAPQGRSRRGSVDPVKGTARVVD